MIRVTHVITTLELGGAEIVLRSLLEHSDRQVFAPEVVSLSGMGPIGRELIGKNIPVVALNLRKPWTSPIDVARLLRVIRKPQPHVVQTWMYHADLIAGIATCLTKHTPLVWGIHHGTPPPKGAPVLVKAGLRSAAFMSGRVPERIVCCSFESRRVHENLGYEPSKMIVIQNGFEVPREIPSTHEEVRNELGLPLDAILIGRVGRYHPQKDHATLIDAFALLRRHRPQVHLVMAGAGIVRSNRKLMCRIEQHGLTDAVHLLGPRSDAIRLTAAFDVAVSSSSFGEGLPMILGEAMALGVPVVATDVGDSAELIADVDRVVPIKDPSLLAAGLLRLIEMGPDNRVRIGARDRNRIRELYNVTGMVEQYEDLYRDVAGGRH